MSLGLFMIRVLTAAPAKLTKLPTIRCRLLVLCGDVVAALAIRALQHNVIARHNSYSFPIANCRLPIFLRNLTGKLLVANKSKLRLPSADWKSTIGNRQLNYSTTSLTVPAPTV